MEHIVKKIKTSYYKKQKIIMKKRRNKEKNIEETNAII